MAAPSIIPFAPKVTVQVVTNGGSYLPWNGSKATYTIPARNVRLQCAMNTPGSFSFDADFIPDPTFPAVMTGYVDTIYTDGTTRLLPCGSIVIFYSTETPTDSATAGDPSNVRYIAAGVIESRRSSPTGEDGVPVVSYSGRTWSALFETVAIYPWGGLAAQPFADARVFSWASPGFDDSGWSAAKQLAQQATGTTDWTLDSGAVAPDGWPNDGTAYWIWADNPGGAGHTPSTSSTSTTTNAAIGTVLFRYTWTPSGDGWFSIFVTADNYYVLYLDGIEIARNTDNPYGWQTTTRFDVFVTSGTTHIIAARAENIGGLSNNPGGLLVSVKLVNPDGTLSAEVHSDNTWVAYPYPSDDAYPGWTVGEIVNAVWDEALARDTSNECPLRFNTSARTFADLEDSPHTSGGANNAWTTAPEVSVPVGSSLLDLLTTLHGQVDVWWADFDVFATNSLLWGGADNDMAVLSLYQGLPYTVNAATYTLGDDLVSISYEASG